ncbi:MAG: DNA recombination protein RmuC, partial [Bacteroidetes bacterium]|nr:DNA recombination protein RmuC [Bacteroidota bacterium]
MNEMNLAITLVLGLGAFFLGRYLAQLKQKGTSAILEAQVAQERATNQQKSQALEVLQSEKERLSQDLIRSQSQGEHLTAKLNDQKKELENIQERFTSEFENLAQKILEAKSEKFTKQN